MKEKHFNKIAEIYDKTLPEHILGHYLNKRKKFIKALGLKGIVLDIGCGTGTLLQALDVGDYKKVGIDSSENMLKEFKKKEADSKVTLADSVSLPFKSSVFNLVVTIATFHHIADPDKINKTVKEMVRVAGNGSVMLIWDHNNLNPYWPILMKKVPQDKGDERLIPSKEIIGYFEQAGIFSCKLYNLGFIPDFVPKVLLPLAQLAEKFLESVPFLRMFSAHNVIVAYKK